MGGRAGFDVLLAIMCHLDFVETLRQQPLTGQLADAALQSKASLLIGRLCERLCIELTT